MIRTSPVTSRLLLALALAAGSALQGFAAEPPADDAAAKKAAMAAEVVLRLKGTDLAANPDVKATVDKALEATKGTALFVEIVEAFALKDRNQELVDLAVASPSLPHGVAALRLALAGGGLDLVKGVLDGTDAQRSVNLVLALGQTSDANIVPLLSPVITDSKRDKGLRQESVRALAKVQEGAQLLIELTKANKLGAMLKQVAGPELQNAPWDDIKTVANEIFPRPATKDGQPLPPMEELVKLTGDAAKGATVFAGVCIACHKVGDKGIDFGPQLSEIGSKLGKDAMYQSILYPDAGISFGYETTVISMKSGVTATGFVVSETDTEVSLKAMGGIVTKYVKADVAKRSQMRTSAMPPGLQKNMTVQELADLVEYLLTLKKP